MRRYDLSLDKYGISHHRYRELLAACRQYEERRQKIIGLYQPKAIVFDGMPHSSNPGSPTEQAVLQLERLKEKQRIIEQTAQEADPGQWKEILKNVSAGIKYENLDYYGGKSQFYTVRRKFFYLLDKKY